MAEVLAIVEELKRIANKKRASYMKRSYLFTAYIVEFQALNGMRIGELLAIQPDNIEFENKKLVINGTIHWRKNGNKMGFKDTTKTASSYRTISLTTRSCDILLKVMLENKKALQWENMYGDRSFIFTSHKGNPLPLTSINRNIQTATQNIGIEKHVTSQLCVIAIYHYYLNQACHCVQ